MKRSRRSVEACVFRLGLSLLLVVSIAMPAMSQCPYTLSTGLSGNTSMSPPPSGISFEVTALQSTRICRLKAPFASGSHLLEIFYNPNGLILVPGSSTGYNTTGWISLGQVTASGFGAGANYAEIPLDLNVMMSPGDKFGFCIQPVTSSTPIYYSSGTPYIFADSFIEINTQAWSGNVPLFGTGSFIYPRRFAGAVVYDEGCYFPDNIISYELLDAQMQPTSFANIPGMVNLSYSVTYPDEDATIGVTVNFRNVITDAIVYTHAFTVSKPAGQSVQGVEPIPLNAGLPSGYFKVEVIFNTKNSCMNYDDYLPPPSTLLLLPPGATMCIVWPGDVNNDGLVNYADRASLNRYIFDANLRSSWLEGPTRFSVVGGLDYLAWRGQPGAPGRHPKAVIWTPTATA